jgi:hypothetical protein
MSLSTPAKGGYSFSVRWVGLTVLVLAAVLAALFWRSFVPGQVVFSNDGPYGAINSDAAKDCFQGLWQDLNWLGNESISASPTLSTLTEMAVGPLVFSKIYCPLAVFLVGLCAWVFLRQLGLAPVACVVAALAAMLNSDFFSTACWGLGSQPICFAANYLALALMTNLGEARHPWVRTVLAGFCVGWGVMEAFDIGAIFSLFTAAYVVYQSWNTQEAAPWTGKLRLGVTRVAVVAVCAGLIAIQTLNVLISTQIQGVAGTAQDKDTKEQQWSFATQWSVPKKEILQVMIPGLFGYRMDTADGGNYWGAIGENPVVPDLIKLRDSGPDQNARLQAKQMLDSMGLWRFSGSGFYAGILVLVVAFWAGCQSFRKRGSPFSSVQRRSIWFWLVVAAISILLSFGKYAMFYRFFYALPYVSTIRNPTKFLHVFSWTLIVLFGYGLHGVSQFYVQNPNARGKRLIDWSRMSGFDRKWLAALVTFLGVAVLGWGLYASSRHGLNSYIQSVGFDPTTAETIADYSIKAVRWFAVFLSLATCLLLLVFSGQFSGNRGWVAAVLLGTLVLLDLGRANLPWIVYWDIGYKYASDPVMDLLRVKPYEHRVASLPYGPSGSIPQLDLFRQLYEIEWKQQIFPKYNVQCLDVIQEPRVPQDKANFLAAIPYPAPTPPGPQLDLRTWELTNTRYLLGLGPGMVEVLNEKLAPASKPFRLVQSFEVVAKPGGSGLYPVDYKAAPSPAGQLGVIEFTGALPRASLYSNWQVMTNDDTTLKTLASPAFDPHKTVLVADPISAPPPGNANAPAGTVEIKPNYLPKRMELEADVKTPAVLLLNDKFTPHWHVWVDGQPKPLLRCNYIARGVYLEPGRHTVVFRYQIPLFTLYISVAAVITALGLCFWLALTKPPSKPAAAVERIETRAPAAKARAAKTVKAA